MNIIENLNFIKKTINKKVNLIAVSKTKSKEKILEAFNAGQRIFGENKVQELKEKSKILPKEIEWHMIGHLQTNKVKYIAPFISLIHTVDSEKILIEIDKRAKQNNRVINCLLQFNISNEENKYGIDLKEGEKLLEKSLNYKNIQIVGVMGMASLTQNKKQIRKEFKNLKHLFDNFQNKNSNIKILSMGMSGDYKIAIEEGSNMIRIGSAIFGNR
ncbi:MAG: YggS family pyridoxal phosphate-dependent enzyme [Flavobacteriales bacterium]|nr:YggS family pyridoxal phosphate-dependent enzyme [Flavobacteriales bacterium]